MQPPGRQFDMPALNYEKWVCQLVFVCPQTFKEFSDNFYCSGCINSSTVPHQFSYGFFS
jgi:hypothetical protein